MTPSLIARGLLGWSNKRSGLEFYRWDENIIPRHKSEWGDLLAEAIQEEVGGRHSRGRSLPPSDYYGRGTFPRSGG